MKIVVQQADLHLLNLRTRMPFKYGIATMTRMPYCFVRVVADVDGRAFTGVSADLLPPKWFTKDPNKAAADEILEMLEVIEHAAGFAIGRAGDSAFELWEQVYKAQGRWGDSKHMPPLLYHFGTSLVERALIEAVCRAAGAPFPTMVRENRLGVRLDRIHAGLRGVQPSDLLPGAPLKQVIARHTVGLSDPLTDEDVVPAERVSDGLPQSLAACIRAYGLRHFKIKVNGRLEQDLARLHRMAEIIPANAPADFAFTLDGNEQYRSLAEFRKFWEAAQASAKLKTFLRGLLFVEQPLHRDRALQPELAGEFRDWSGHPPFIIDESDATIESLPAALRLGYAGTSHKNCKGLFKGLANRCLLAQRQAQRPAGDTAAPRFLMSGEDLCNVGPVALLQDLAVMAALGVESVERNGQHYVAGLSAFPADIQTQVLVQHPDLYRRSAAGWPTLRIEDGRIGVESLNRAPFGVGFGVKVEQFMPASRWRQEGLPVLMA